MRGGRLHPWGSWEGGLAGLSLLAMSIIQTTATTDPGARRRPAVTPRMGANRSAADGRVWIPWAEMAGARVEHAWTGSRVVLGVDGMRTDAPLREARRTLRRMLGATALVIAIAVALAPPVIGHVAAA